MRHIRRRLVVFSLRGMFAGICFCVSATNMWAQQKGLPVSQETVGETNALVRISGQIINEGMIDAYCEKHRVDLSSVDPKNRFTIRRGILGQLIQREFAFRRLAELGGEALQTRIERGERTVLEGRVSLDGKKQLGLFERREIAWEIAWGEYLNRQMTQENLEKFFQFRKRWFDGTSASVSQIFLPVASLLSDSDDASEVESLLRSVKQQIGDGKLSFAEAASRYSKSPSAATGGQIGWVKELGDLPTPVLRAVLDGEPGTIVGPVESRLGWHLLLIHESVIGTRSFSELEDQSGIRRAAADFLFERLVREGAKTSDVTFISPEWQLDLTKWTSGE